MRVTKKLKLEQGQIIELKGTEFQVLDTHIKRRGLREYESVITFFDLDKKEDFALSSGEEIGGHLETVGSPDLH